MYEVLKNGPISGGLNFDSKTRRASNTYEDMFKAYILGMDTFALGLLNAAKIIEDGRLDAFVEERYASWRGELGKKIRAGKATLEELSAEACKLGSTDEPGSGKEEELQEIVNSVLFSA